MFSLLYSELLKMKGSKMFLVSLSGAAVSPVLTFFMHSSYHQNKPSSPTFDELFNQTHLFIVFLVGTMLFALITTYIFNREYEEDTLKNLLTIPVGRNQLIISKMTILLLWVEVIMLFSFLTALILGAIGGFEGFDKSIVINHLQKYLYTGILLYMLTPVIVIITMFFKNYVPSIAFSIFVTVGTLIIMQSKYISLYPWTIPMVMTFKDVEAELEYPYVYSWVILIAVFIISMVANMIYFNKTDVN